MPFKSNLFKSTATFNKYGLHLRWPRLWIILLGFILVFLCFSIAGMEAGHTLFDWRRSTALGGFIIFIPLLICAIFILITACKPRLILLRITVVLCCMMIILCMALIAYDILVLIDPTRCFFFNCNDAIVIASNSTTIVVVSGWPLYITWPTYFQTNMTAKRIFQGVQILCASLFILFASLYLLTYFIYRHIRFDQQNMDDAHRRTFTTNDANRATPIRNSSSVSRSYSQYKPSQKVTTYSVEGQSNGSFQYPYSATPVVVAPKKSKTTTFIKPRAPSVNYDRLCTRCITEPRMMLVTFYEKQNFLPHLCINCNNEVAHERRKQSGQTKSIRTWRH